MTVKKLILMAILTAVALIIFIIEAQIPLPIPVPGVKLGLANTVTLFALFYRKQEWKQGDGSSASYEKAGEAEEPFTSEEDEKHPSPCFHEEPSPCFPVFKLTVLDAFAILWCRIILGAIFTGRPIVIIYSLAGGVLGFAAQVIMRRFVNEKQIWVCGAIGAVFHNIGQILAAVIITGTPSIMAYLPVLVIAGIVTGVFTGLIAQFTVHRLNKVSPEPSP